MHGNPITVEGTVIETGSKFPEFTLTGTDMQDLSNSDFNDKIMVIAVVPSLDTPVCDTEIRTFNEKASKLSSDVILLTVSRDLPFAQARWCGAASIDRVITASDYKHRTFGQQTGTEWIDSALLTRAVFVVGKDGLTKHVEYVDSIEMEPDYDTALASIQLAL